MANPEAHETDHSRRKVFELKKELQRLLKTILDEDDYGMQVTDETLRVLSCLKEFQLKKSHSISVDCLDVPEVFRCLISGEIMANPVVLANGQEHGVELPEAIQDIDEDFITDVDCSYLNSLLEKMSSSLSDQKEAAGFV